MLRLCFILEHVPPHGETRKGNGAFMYMVEQKQQQVSDKQDRASQQMSHKRKLQRHQKFKHPIATKQA